MPGAEPANFRRSQKFVYSNQAPTEHFHEPPVQLEDALVASLKGGPTYATAAQRALGQSRSSATLGAKASMKPAIQPAWMKHDRQCLRFYMYYQEAVVEHVSENYRIRNVVMTYFLEDGTMQVTEPKVENSGIWPQGPFVKRHRIPKGEGFWGPQDFKCGSEITLYARTFRIVGCDEFTKWFYQNAGLDIGVEEEAPLDGFTESALQRKENMTKNIGFPREVMEGKEFNELKLGGGRKNNKLQQFLENDRKVLRFYAYWDDTTKYGARWYFTLHYFLADDTCEINNMYMRNVGRWLCPVFMTRGPLELNPSTVIAPGMIKAPSPILMPKDIEIGKTIPVYGRELFIYDADPATYEFYKGYMGKDMQKIEIPEPKYQHFMLLPPPHNGTYGSHEDTLGSCLQVTTRKPPKRDLVKLMVNSGRVLRYEAVPELVGPEDSHRKFIIAIFLMDDTIAVYEVKQRNSGCLEGKFKERGLTIDPRTGESYKPGDFYVGAVCKISAMQLRITRSDEYTLKHMEANMEEYPQSSIALVALKLAALADSKVQWASMLPEDFRDYVAEKLGFELTDQELITVLRYANVRETAEINMEKLFEVIAEVKAVA
jgi:hypothetical protein